MPLGKGISRKGRRWTQEEERKRVRNNRVLNEVGGGGGVPSARADACGEPMPEQAFLMRTAGHGKSVTEQRKDVRRKD